MTATEQRRAASLPLKLEEVTAGYFAHDIVLDTVTVDVPPAAVTAVLGPNGSGKSTALRVATGLLKPRSGRVLLGDRDITELSISQRLTEGICLLPQGRSVFPTLSVEDNLQLGAWTKRKDRGFTEERTEAMFERYPTLKPLKSRAAGSLSGGQARLLEFARTLILDPGILVIDEPSVGLSPLLVGEVYEEIARLKEEGRTILLVDQNVQAAVEVADSVVTLAYGKNHLSGDKQNFEGNLDDLIKQWLSL